MKPKDTAEHFILSSSPHTHANVTVRRLMLDVTQPETLEKFRTADILDLGTGGGFPGIPLAILFRSEEHTSELQSRI